MSGAQSDRRLASCRSISPAPVCMRGGSAEHGLLSIRRLRTATTGGPHSPGARSLAVYHSPPSVSPRDVGHRHDHCAVDRMHRAPCRQASDLLERHFGGHRRRRGSPWQLRLTSTRPRWLASPELLGPTSIRFTQGIAFLRASIEHAAPSDQAVESTSSRSRRCQSGYGILHIPPASFRSVGRNRLC